MEGRTKRSIRENTKSGQISELVEILAKKMSFLRNKNWKYRIILFASSFEIARTMEENSLPINSSLLGLLLVFKELYTRV